MSPVLPLVISALCIVLSTALCIVAALVYRKVSSNVPIPGLPLAPSPHWLFGHVDLFMSYYTVSQDYAKRLGEAVCFFHPLTGPSLLSSSPLLVEKVLKDRQLVRQNDVTRSIFSRFFKNGLLCLDGDMWKKHVRVLGPMIAVHRLKAAVPPMTKAAQDMVKKWQAQLLQEPDKVFDVSEDLQFLSLAVIGQFMLGKSFGGNSDVLQHCDVMMKSIQVFEPLKAKFMRTLLGDPPDVRAARSSLRRLVADVMDQCTLRPELQEGHAIGQMMRAIREEGVDFSREEVLDEVVMIVFASHDTTASSLMWFLKLLSAEPRVQDQLRAELQQVLGDEEPSYEDICSRLPYLDMCFKELMRLACTAAGLSRTLSADITLPTHPDVSLKEGTSISLSMSAMHLSPKFWWEPQTLWPERWEEGEGRGQAAKGVPINPCAYAPFGVGQRSCLGVKMATLELKVLLVQLIRSLQFLPTQDPALDRMDCITQVTRKPKYPHIKMRAVAAAAAAH